MNRLKQLKHFHAIVKRTEALRHLNASLLLLNDACNELESIQGDADYFIRDNIGFDIEEKYVELNKLFQSACKFNAEKQQQLHNQK